MTQEPKIFPYIERLLQGAEVVWTTLGDEKKIEIANANRRPVKASERISGNIPYYGANNIQDYVEGYTHEGTYILIAEDGTKSIENYSVQWATGKFWANNHVHVLRGKNNVDSRFIYYYLQTVNFVPFLTGGDRAKLTKAKLLEIQIPLPPLSVQQEIVRILDKFTQLEAELEAELDCRKRQYEYYRNKLLTFNEIVGAEIVWKTLGEVATYSDKRIKASSVEENNYIGVENLLQNKAGKIISNYIPSEGNVTAYNINDVLIGNIRPYLKKIWLADNNGGASGDVLVIHLIDNSVNAKYLYHILADDKFFNYNMKYAKGAKMPRGDKQKIMDYLIPFPPLEEQQRIANILDKFDTLVNSISEGLPKEIALRRKQYEYYRERLLSFPKQ